MCSPLYCILASHDIHGILHLFNRIRIYPHRLQILVIASPQLVNHTRRAPKHKKYDVGIRTE